MKVRRILSTKSREVITISPNQSIKEAVDLLVNHNIGALVVVDPENKPVGIISERDVIQGAARDENVLSLMVEALMTKEVITGMPQDDVAQVVATMTDKRFRHLPIVEEGELIGIVSIGDILKVQRDEYRGEVDTLETQILAEE